MSAQIPIVNMASPYTEELSRALREAGFCYIRNHGVSFELQSRLFRLFREFFIEDLSFKNKIAMANVGLAWRGYFPPGGELTSGRPDRKEGIYFGSEGEPGLPMHGHNQWPAGDRYREMAPAVLEYIDQLTELGQSLMSAIGQGLGLDADYFRRRFTEDPTVLFRAFNYQKHIWKEGDDEWGVREHTDYGFLTILLQDSSGGLQVRDRNGEWLDVPPIENTFVINIGDMLEVWTHGIYRSTPHRVRNQGATDRISLPFFFDPNWHSTLEPIEKSKLPNGLLNQVETGRSDRWDGLNLSQLSRDLTYGNFIWQKVRKVFPDLTS